MEAHRKRPPLFGRDDETRLLADGLDRVASGRLAVVLLEGEAGIGKTRLLETALAAAATRGMPVVAGQARELEGSRPFGLLVDAFGITAGSPDPRRARIASLLATQADGERGPLTVTSDPGLQFRVVDALGDLIEELALSGPLVIGMDDLQWADPSTLLTLSVTTRHLTDLPLAVVACFRPAPRAPMLDQLIGSLVADGARHLVVGALDGRAVHDLAIDVLAAEPRRNLSAQIAGTAGNPLFVNELLQVLLREGAISIDGGFAEVEGSSLPPPLRVTIVRRLSFLTDDTIRTLTSASILGSQFTLTDLATTTGRSAGDLSDSLRDALRSNVVRDDGDLLCFRHDLIRDALYEDLAADIRRALHREAGQRLAARGAPTLQVAEHLARGALAGDTEAVDWLSRAAREALAGSPQVAAELLRRAVELTAPTDPGRDRLLVRQAQATMWAGRVAEAQTLCRALLNRTHDLGVEALALFFLGHALLSSGRPVEALRELNRAARSPTVTDSERAASLAWSSSALVWLGQLESASAAAQQARELAVRIDDPVSLSIAMSTLSVVSRLRGHLQASLRTSDDALRLLEQSSTGTGHRYPLHGPQAYALIELDRLDEAAAAIEAGVRSSEQLGAAWHLASYQMVRILERFTGGQWDDAVAEIEAMSELAVGSGEAYGLVIALSLLSVIRVHRNDIVGAERALRSALDQTDQNSDVYGRHWAQWARSLVLESAGHPDEAYAILDEVWQRCTELDLTMDHRLFGADLVRLSLTTGNPDRARQTAAAVARLAQQNDVESLQALARRCQGLADGDAGLLAEAARRYAGTPRPLERAGACEEAGAALQALGDPDTARALLQEACETYEDLGATRDLARAEALLRKAGIRRGRRGQRGRPRSGWASLTESERAVAGLVAEGLSNPQIGERLFVSRRTVQTHLTHIFAKLDLASRSHLAAEVTRRGA